MSSQSLSVPHVAETRTPLRKAWALSPLLTLTVLMSIVALPVVIAAALIDPVQITGVNGWIKPAKFLISIALYCGTLLWMLSFVQRRRRWIGILGGLVGVVFLGEMVIIVLQIMRGTTSHFNNSTPFDTALFNVMGALISTLALLNLVVGIWLLRARVGEPVLAAGLRWGIWIALAGMLLAFLMTVPTSAQQAAMAAGEQQPILGAHSVGVADGGPGLPLVGWSTVGGDLRVPHFVGLHAMQIMPLLAWLFLRPAAVRRWGTRQRVRMMHVAGVGYAGLIALLTWQALRGQPLLAPDGLTLVAAFTWLGLLAAAGVLALRQQGPPIGVHATGD